MLLWGETAQGHIRAIVIVGQYGHHRASGGDRGLRGLDARAAAVIRGQAVRLAVDPLDMHSGTESALAARRLNRGKFVWPEGFGGTLALTRAQLDVLVLGLP